MVRYVGACASPRGVSVTLKDSGKMSTKDVFIEPKKIAPIGTIHQPIRIKNCTQMRVYMPTGY